MNEWKVKFFESQADYDEFIDGLIESYEEGELPVAVTIEDLEGIRIKDIECLLRAINRDSSFDVESTLYICKNCNKPHLTVLIDKPEDESTGILN